MTTLVEEEPYAAVVNNHFISTTCSKCFAWNLQGTEESVKLGRCAGCRFLYYCSAKCQKEDWKDHKHECHYMSSTKEEMSDLLRLICRMLRKTKSRPDLKAFNGRTYDSFEYECSAHGKYANFVEKTRMMYPEIMKFMGAKAPDFETVLLAHSKCAVNSLQIIDNSPLFIERGEAIYLGISGHKHSCRPDAFIVFSGSKIVLRSTEENAVYSSELTICYPSTHLFRDNVMRKEHLTCYNINCNCEECQDKEADKTRIACRSRCCPNGTFSTHDFHCCVCSKEISKVTRRTASLAMSLLRIEIHDFEENKMTSLSQVPKWIDDFDYYSEILTDDNTYLISLADMIHTAVFQKSPLISLKFAEFCVPYTRGRPHCPYRANLMFKRFVLHELIGRPLEEIKAALEEALEAVKIVYGEDHVLTKELQLKQTEKDISVLKIV